MILNWINNVEHTFTREQVSAKWYKKYLIRICKVKRAYGFGK